MNRFAGLTMDGRYYTIVSHLPGTKLLLERPFLQAAAAAIEPLRMVALYSKPGCRRWVWMSMNPGQTTFPEASITRTPPICPTRIS